MDYKTECGCIVVESPPNFRIKYCPKHEAAPALYAALKSARNLLNQWTSPKTCNEIDLALAEARGKGG